MESTTSFQVVVIGAGMAGISAARALKEQNISYIIFESSDRIGGRLYSKSIPNVG
jgi:monoamine oxidase